MVVRTFVEGSRGVLQLSRRQSGMIPMNTHRIHTLVSSFALVALSIALAGCEGINRKHDNRVLDIQPPAENAPRMADSSAATLNFPDLVEGMMERRQAYIDSLMEMERSYLLASEVVKANWARRQRELIERADVYPYLTPSVAEQRLEVSPEQSIAEADAAYDQGVKLVGEFRDIPFAGLTEGNKTKARQALDIFKRVLRDYPKSDKVDDCAFWCGEIYKEYLRDDDPDDELAVRYYLWAVALDPNTPHPARFSAAAVYDFRRHERVRALDLYHQVLDVEEAGNESNMRFAATRIEQLTDEERSHLSPNSPEGTVASESLRTPVSARTEDDEPGS